MVRTRLNDKCCLTVHFIQDELISGEVQFSEVEVSDVAVSLLEKTGTGT